MAERKIVKANRGFKGVWIPSDYWLDSNLSTQEILFLTEIESLDTGKDNCYASNQHFSDFFGLSKSRVSEVIKSLHKKKYISIDYKYRGKEIEKRTIKVVGKPKGGIRNIEEGYSENAKGSNTSFSNTKDTMSSKPDLIPYSQIINYLNDKTGKAFKVTQKWKELIKARWNEGQRVEDFEKVIDIKSQQWINNAEMSKYLRPVTLFGNKFDEYRNEYREPKATPKDDYQKQQEALRKAYEQ
ncbi:hypothetical protein IGI37_000068 [Enterococcus sp. AZ194]|uniref:conserved phage C-terminal domain-containing protein n=1 Tax=Enterococcus sp. AZ194 TaxID=2774629 RepID=UPI003F240D49